MHINCQNENIEQEKTSNNTHTQYTLACFAYAHTYINFQCITGKFEWNPKLYYIPLFTAYTNEKLEYKPAVAVTATATTITFSNVKQ